MKTAVDARFEPEIKLLKQIKRDYLNPDSTLKDGAINKIANLAGKGKDQTLARLEQIVPGIREDINILKALEDIEYTKGQKVGAYLRGAGGGFVLSGGNPAIAIASAIVASPQIAVPILKAYGIITNTSKDVINGIVSKISRGVKPVAEEAKIVTEAIETYAKEFVEHPRIGLQTEFRGHPKLFTLRVEWNRLQQRKVNLLNEGKTESHPSVRKLIEALKQIEQQASAIR